MKFKITTALIRALFRLIAHVEVEGMQNVPRSGGLVAVTNHIGRLDPGLPYVLIDRDDIIMLVAEKYRKTMVFRWLTWAIDGIWVDRFNADFNAVRTSLRRLKRGGMMIVAPEGTRSPSGALIRARSGAGYLAMKSGAPILPAAIIGTEDSVVKASLRSLRRVHIRVRFGEVFQLPPLADLDRDRALEAYDDEIMCRIAALLPPERRGVYADHPRLKEILAKR
ncbi:MAG TPA: lysophospholipid acyltransferase family protein [Anaerolineales bacterium]|jgi:1-acyl-sn-glycerol-3-phosphate acyltransferase|nr:lysophospholipid acyltransferase family protein [Anaerolineales bacterium]